MKKTIQLLIRDKIYQNTKPAHLLYYIKIEKKKGSEMFPYVSIFILAHNSSWIEHKYNERRTPLNLTGRNLNSLKPRFIHQNQNLNPFDSNPYKKPELQTCLAKIQKNRTSNPSEPRFVYQNRTTKPT